MCSTCKRFAEPSLRWGSSCATSSWAELVLVLLRPSPRGRSRVSRLARGRGSFRQSSPNGACSWANGGSKVQEPFRHGNGHLECSHLTRADVRICDVGSPSSDIGAESGVFHRHCRRCGEVSQDQGRLHVPSGAVRFPPSQGEGVADIMGSFDEVVAAGYTRRPYHVGLIDLVSRNDRLFSDIATSDVLCYRASGVVLRRVFENPLPPDHPPVELRSTVQASAPLCGFSPILPRQARRGICLRRLGNDGALRGVGDED